MEISFLDINITVAVSGTGILFSHFNVIHFLSLKFHEISNNLFNFVKYFINPEHSFSECFLTILSQVSCQNIILKLWNVSIPWIFGKNWELINLGSWFTIYFGVQNHTEFPRGSIRLWSRGSDKGGFQKNPI